MQYTLSLSFVSEVMKVIQLLLYGVTIVEALGLSSNLEGKGPGDDGLDGVRALAKRQVSFHAQLFTFERVQGSGDVFTLSDTNPLAGGVKIQCTTVSACSRGLYKFVKIIYTALYT